MFRWPCKDYLKGSCTNSFCDEWHPPECLFYKTKSCCRFGEKCSYAHRQVDEQPDKRSKKNDDKSAVAMVKKNDLHESVWQAVVNRDKSHERSGRPDIKRDTCHELKQGLVGRRSSNEKHRGPEVPEEKVQVVECLGGLARVTSKELAITHFVKGGTLQNACSTRPRVVVGLVKSALVRIVKLMNSRLKGPKRMMTKVQWLC